MAVLPLLLLFLLNFQANTAMKTELPSFPGGSKLETYIVHVKKPENQVLGPENDVESWYLSFFPDVSGITITELPSLLYSYRNVLSGFSARLTEEHLEDMKQKDGFIGATPETVLSLQTTHTPEFLGLNQKSGIWRDSKMGKGMIIGVLDTGIAPGHPSFDDAGMPPSPAKWRGKCEFNATICNKKLIGARSFLNSNSLLKGGSPADEEGHGTHTAGTAAGAFVSDADALGNARGTAVGMAPLAHLAIYKVCSEQGCASSDILAALDAAIDDGVDVLSLSLGGKSRPFYADSIAIGAFAATQKGIFVSCAAGNSGPSKSTLSNEAPWILTVGASTIDRKIVAVAKLGNGEEFYGQSLFQPRDFTSLFLPLVYAGNNGNSSSAFCGDGSLANIDVKGKVVICEVGGGISRIKKGSLVKNAGGAAMILINQQSYGFTTFSDPHVLPATHVSYIAGLKIKAYINSTSKPKASIIFKGTFIGGASTTPAMAAFSSRGPSLASPGILKPDITGPGVNILAAWPFQLDDNKHSKSTFNVISGTSMSCPHLSGIAALIKSLHPDWSPAAVKSAIMTTAISTNGERRPILDQNLQPANLFAIGAGHVDPPRAADPGLVYDIQPDDYIPYLCGMYKDKEVSMIVRNGVDCSKASKIEEGELNYPSFTVTLGADKVFNRTVTNVGKANSIYSVLVEAPFGVLVRVQPRVLVFSKVNQKATYSVTFSRPAGSVGVSGEFGEGYLRWVSGKHDVRSPISVKFN